MRNGKTHKGITINSKDDLISLASVDMNTNSNKKYGNKTKEDDCVDQDRHSTRLHLPKLHHSVLPWQLKQKTRT